MKLVWTQWLNIWISLVSNLFYYRFDTYACNNDNGNNDDDDDDNDDGDDDDMKELPQYSPQLHTLQ